MMHCICKALKVELPMPRVLCVLMMHCICNLRLEPWGWNIPCLGFYVYAHDALYLQSHVGAMEVELPMPRVLCVDAHDALYLQSHFAALEVKLPMPRLLWVCS